MIRNKHEYGFGHANDQTWAALCEEVDYWTSLEMQRLQIKGNYEDLTEEQDFIMALGFHAWTIWHETIYCFEDRSVSRKILFMPISDFKKSVARWYALGRPLAIDEDRKKYLHAMRYSEYLKTPEWAERRKEELKRADYKCELCFNPHNLHVHHKTYEHRGYEQKNELIVLCSNCHAKFHDKLSQR